MNSLQSILLFCGSSSILNVIFVSIITLFLIVVIIRLFKKFPNSDIIDICEAIGGKFLKWLVGSIFALYIIVTSSLFYRNNSHYLLRRCSNYLFATFLFSSGCYCQYAGNEKYC